MEKLITASLIALMTAGFTFTSAAQTAPQAVKEALSSKYPNATHVEWDYDDDDDEEEENYAFEAEFLIDSQHYEAFFAEDGTWVKTERRINKQAIPEAVVKVIKSDFASLRFDDAYKVITPEGTQIKVEVEMEDEGDNSELEYLLFEENGTLIKKGKDNEGFLFFN